MHETFRPFIALTEQDLVGWQAVAVALINMIGSVLMAMMREQTNRARLNHGKKG